MYAWHKSLSCLICCFRDVCNYVEMYYGMYRPLCPVRCLWGIWATQSFRTGSKTGTQWPVPSTPHNIIFSWFAQWACGFWTIVRPGRPKKTCPLCLVRGLKKRQKRPYENYYVQIGGNNIFAFGFGDGNHTHPLTSLHSLRGISVNWYSLEFSWWITAYSFQ